MATSNSRADARFVNIKRGTKNNEMVETLNLKEGQDVSVLYECIDRVTSLKLKELTIAGLHRYMNNFEPTEKYKILYKLAAIKDHLKLEDFPCSVEELSNFIAFSKLFNLAIVGDSKAIFQYTPPGGYSKKERNRRAAQKRKQISEFNELNRIARERIVLLKSQQLKEKDIEKILAKENIFSLNGKKLSQGSINRMYHGFMGMWKNFENLNYCNAGKADTSLSGGETSPDSNSLALDEMGKDPVKIFDETIDLIFKANEIPPNNFYLCFTGREQGVVNEILYVRRHYLNGNKLSIDIKEQTILSPGRYQVFVCTDPENYDETSFGRFTCDLYRKYIEIDDVRFVRNPVGEVLPFYTLPQLGN